MTQPNGALIDLLYNAMTDANDIDATFTTFAEAGARALTDLLTDPDECSLPMLLDALADYAELLNDGRIDGAGRYLPADIHQAAITLANLLEPED